MLTVAQCFHSVAEGNVLFNDTVNTFLITLYGVGSVTERLHTHTHTHTHIYSRSVKHRKPLRNFFLLLLLYSGI